jgi:hypothetical protein
MQDYGEEMSERRRSFVRVRMLLVALAATSVVLLTSAAGLAAPNAPPSVGRDLAVAFFSNTLTRAEVVSVIARTVHDYRIDEGRVLALRPGGVDLLERDGTRQTIRLSATTQIVGIGRLFAPVVARGARVVVVRDGDGPAIQVRPSGSARALGKVLLGATLARAEVLTYSAKTLHDFRIDEGRIVAVRPSAVVLLERDGTRQTITVSATTLVTEAGQPADMSSVTRGLTAVTIREGDGPALEIRLVPLGVVVGR